MKKLAVLFLLLGASSPAVAGDFYASQLKDYCDLSRREGYCTGYMAGALQMILVLQAVADNNNLTSPFCVPLDATTGQLQLAYLLHLKAHPEKLRHAASNVLNDALKDAFPCPAKQ